MNSLAQQLINIYKKIKKQEWDNPGHTPPDSINYLGQLTDEVFLLYSLRSYLRLKLYPNLFKNFKGKWDSEHFHLVWSFVEYNRQRIYLNPLLDAYVRLFEIIKQPATAPEEVSEVSSLLVFLRTNKASFPAEDWVDIISVLSSYCTTAENDGLPAFVPYAFTARILLVDAKFGKGWRRKHINLPYATFFNVIKQGLQVKNEFTWSQLEIDFIPTTTGQRTAYEWLRRFSRKYRSRLASEIEDTMVNLMEAMICFDEGALVKADKALQNTKRTSNEIININTKILRLQVMYALANDPTQKAGVYLREYLKKVGPEINNLTAALTYLGQEKDKFPTKRVDAFWAWLKGFIILSGAFNTIVVQGKAPNAVARAKIISQKRKRLPKAYHTLRHQRKEWLEAAFKKLADPGNESLR